MDGFVIIKCILACLAFLLVIGLGCVGVGCGLYYVMKKMTIKNAGIVFLISGVLSAICMDGMESFICGTTQIVFGTMLMFVGGGCEKGSKDSQKSAEEILESISRLETKKDIKNAEPSYDI